MRQFTTRFAPSPTGLLHLGHAFSALTAFEAAKAAQGRFLLRIDDIDQTRCRPEFEDDIYKDLAWLGLEWEKPVMRQSERFSAYQEAVDQLLDQGLVYRCFKTRKEVAAAIASAPHGSNAGEIDKPAYIGAPLSKAAEQQRLDQGAPYAWRLSLMAIRDYLGSEIKDLCFFEDGAGPNSEHGSIALRLEIIGDAIIARKDALTSYHLACVVDDAAQGVTHIIRGADLFEATHVQRLLQRLLNLPAPAYRHHRLILDKTGKRFAKRDKAVTLHAMREAGITPHDIRARLGVSAATA